MQTSSPWRPPTPMSLNASDAATKPPTRVRGLSSGSRTLATSPRTSVSPLASVRGWAIRVDACPPSRPRGIFPAAVQAAARPVAISAMLVAVELAAALEPAVVVELAAAELAVAAGLAAAVALEPAVVVELPVAVGLAAVVQRNARAMAMASRQLPRVSLPRVSLQSPALTAATSTTIPAADWESITPLKL